MTPSPDAAETPPPLVVVCGLGRFGLRLVELLREQGVTVNVITTVETREDHRVAAVDLGAQLIVGDFRYPDARAAACIGDADALILAASSNQANLETALDVRGEYPNLRIVMRHSDIHLAGRLERDFGIYAVLSPPDLAAPEFVHSALEAAPPPPPGTPHRRHRPRRIATRRWLRQDTYLLTLALILLFVSGMLMFHDQLRLSWMDAAYFTATILTTVGFGDFNLQREHFAIKLYGIFLMFGGATLLAALSSFLTHFILSGAAVQARAERTARRYKNHVILCGLGSVGYAIARDLRERKVKVVVVDTSLEDDRARDLASRVPALIGDATREETLLKAGIDRAHGLIAAVSSDALNLEIGLVAQTLIEARRPERPLRIVLRCFDPDLAHRIHAVSQNYALLSSAELAAPLFIQAALPAAPGEKP